MRSTNIHYSNVALSLLSPALGLIQGVTSLSWQYRKWSLILFITLFGTLILFPENADSVRHQQNVYSHYLNLSFPDFVFELKEIVLLRPEKGTNDDVFIHCLSYLVAFLGVPYLFFGVVSFVFGYFYVSALSKILIWKPEIKLSFLALAFVLLMITFRGIDNINSVRYWTSGWILFYGIFGFYQTNKAKYILLTLLAPLVHICYLVLLIPVYLAFLLRYLSPRLLILAYILSFFISLDPAVIIPRINATELGQSKVEAYYHEDGVNTPKVNTQGESQDKAWYNVYGRAKVLHWGTHTLAISVIILGFYRRSKMTLLELGLFSTGLLLATIANLGDFIGAFYNRVLINGGMYIVATNLLLLLRGGFSSRNRNTYYVRKAFLWGNIVLFLPHLIYTLANILQYTSVFMLSLPIVGWIYPSSNMSIREFIGLFM